MAEYNVMTELHIVPTEQVLLTQVALPKASQAAWRKAVPFALEEQLAEDVAVLHFALGDYHDGQLAVAIIKKTLMPEAGAQVMLPDVLTLPYLDNGWVAKVERERVLVRTGWQQGFAVSHDNLSMMLSAAPETIHVYGDATLFSGHEVEVFPLDACVVDKAQLLAEPPLNLLQDVYRPTIKVSKQKRYWRWALYAACAWLLVLFVGHIGAYVYLRQQNNRLQAQMLHTYQQVYPASQAVIEPRYRLERSLQALLRRAESNPFHAILSRVGQVLRRDRQISVDRLSYKGRRLSITVHAPNSAVLQALVAHFAQARLHLKQGKQIVVGQRVTTTIEVSA